MQKFLAVLAPDSAGQAGEHLRFAGPKRCKDNFKWVRTDPRHLRLANCPVSRHPQDTESRVLRHFALEWRNLYSPLTRSAAKLTFLLNKSGKSLIVWDKPAMQLVKLFMDLGKSVAKQVNGFGDLANSADRDTCALWPGL